MRWVIFGALVSICFLGFYNKTFSYSFLKTNNSPSLDISAPVNSLISISTSNLVITKGEQKVDLSNIILVKNQLGKEVQLRPQTLYERNGIKIYTKGGRFNTGSMNSLSVNCQVDESAPVGLQNINLNITVLWEGGMAKLNNQLEVNILEPPHRDSEPRGNANPLNDAASQN